MWVYSPGSVSSYKNAKVFKLSESDQGMYTLLKIGCYITPLGQLGFPVIKNFKENFFNNWDALFP